MNYRQTACMCIMMMCAFTVFGIIVLYYSFNRYEVFPCVLKSLLEQKCYNENNIHFEATAFLITNNEVETAFMTMPCDDMSCQKCDCNLTLGNEYHCWRDHILQFSCQYPSTMDSLRLICASILLSAPIFGIMTWLSCCYTNKVIQTFKVHENDPLDPS